MPRFAKNKKAFFEYEILETLEAGLKLTGNEVKSIRTQGIRLTGSFVGFHKNNAYLASLHIPKYKYSTVSSEFNPERNRRLLLSRKQIDFLRGKSQEKGLTVIPLSLYSKGNLIKLEISVARGKKRHDKRQTIKNRQLDRQTRRYLKQTY